MNMEGFDYTAAIKRLEAIAAAVEDPRTGIDEMDKWIGESDALIEKCRAYLREAREKTDKLA